MGIPLPQVAGSGHICLSEAALQRTEAFRWRRRARRIAFFFSIRRSSLFEICQRLRRTVLKIPLLVTRLRKRRSSDSCDSFGFNRTVAIIVSHPLPVWDFDYSKPLIRVGSLPIVQEHFHPEQRSQVRVVQSGAFRPSVPSPQGLLPSG